MLGLGDLFDRLKGLAALDSQVSRLNADLKEMTDLHRDTRDRVIRLEGLIEGATRSVGQKRLR